MSLTEYVNEYDIKTKIDQSKETNISQEATRKNKNKCPISDIFILLLVCSTP